MKKIISKVKNELNDAIVWFSNHRIVYYLLCITIGLSVCVLNTEIVSRPVYYECKAETVNETAFITDYGWSDSVCRISKYRLDGEGWIRGGHKIIEYWFDIANKQFYYNIYGITILDI